MVFDYPTMVPPTPRQLLNFSKFFRQHRMKSLCGRIGLKSWRAHRF